MNAPFDTDVLIIGSGFGGSVAALRFAEAGQRVTVLERGDWVRRDDVRVGPSMFWKPQLGLLGMNDMRMRGKRIMPWLGACVGGGSQVFAGTLKRSTDFGAYPAALREAAADMNRYYARAERMMEVTRHPDAGPHGDNPLTRLLVQAGDRLSQEEPDLVRGRGLVPLAMQFAADEQAPGAKIRNAHGAEQCTAHPEDQSILGGDVDSKNSLDRNYLHRARKHGAQIQALTEVDRIEPLPLRGYRVHFIRRQQGSTQQQAGSLCARTVVLAAGSIGSTQILLRNRDVHGTLPKLSQTLGSRYTTNGNFMSFMLPGGVPLLAWIGFAVIVAGAAIGSVALALAGALVYYARMLVARRYEPDLGPTNSDYIELRGRNGGQGSVYIEAGRYPTPIRLGLAVLLSALGLYRPSRYRWIVAASRVIEWIPPLGALAHSLPVPLLQMGRDDAVGTMALDRKGEVSIDYRVETNRAFYEHLDRLGKRMARACGALWLPNLLYRSTGRLEIPHNQGGAPMGESAADGVVDHAGRVFGYRDLMVLDGSIIPQSPGPNPALTILALAERAMELAVTQHDSADANRTTSVTRRAA